MAVQSTKLGPGHLTIGAVGTTREWGAQIRSTTLTPEADDGDVLTVLSGEEVVDAGEETWTLEGSILQSYDADSLLLWANQNTGKSLPFKFRPVDTAALEARGNVVVRSLAIGGNVKERNTSDFSFKATDVTITAAGDN